MCGQWRLDEGLFASGSFSFFLSIQRRERVGAVLVGLGRKGMGGIVSVRTMGRGGAIINDERWITMELIRAVQFN